MAVSDEQRPSGIGWFDSRLGGIDWTAEVSAIAMEHDRRDTLRAEMIAELLGACELVQRGDDWHLRECEGFSARLATLADLAARVRASVNREGAMQ